MQFSFDSKLQEIADKVEGGERLTFEDDFHVLILSEFIFRFS